MFTLEEALIIWHKLNENAYLYTFGELVLTMTPKFPIPTKEKGYFIRARNYVFTREMVTAYNQVCEEFDCTYRFENGEIIFYKGKKQ